MDDFNNMMESEKSVLPEMMTDINPAADTNLTDNTENTVLTTENQQQSLSELDITDKNTTDNIQENDKSDCAKLDDDSDRKIPSNEHSDDKCAVETNDINENKSNENIIETNDKTKNDELENQLELDDQNNINESIKDKGDDEFDMNCCRICMSMENLVDVFDRNGKKHSFRICDLIMKLAPSVKISKRDYLPQTICGNCAERIDAAYELRLQCEETDKFLRSKLKRSKKTRRAPAEFVLIDCAESSSDSDDDQKSDDEFQLSEESEELSETDSESSYDDKKKSTPIRRPPPKRGPPPKRPNVIAQQPPSKKPKTTGIVYIKAAKSDDEDDAAKKKSIIKKPIVPTNRPSPANRLKFRCDVCNRPCSTAEALSQHRRMHADEKCNVCSMVFKQRSALLQHMQRHREDPERNCQKCHRVFATKNECERHVHAAHPETVACNKCKRYFPNKGQLDNHKCISDRKTIESTSKKKTEKTDVDPPGRDFIKSIAPLNLTTTYWSDSFSD